LPVINTPACDRDSSVSARVDPLASAPRGSHVSGLFVTSARSGVARCHR
jgi:hypothetical protein